MATNTQFSGMFFIEPKGNPKMKRKYSPMNEILLHDTSVVEADFYFQTHVTNPFLKKETIDAALDNFLSQYPYQCDSLFVSTRTFATV